VLRRRPIKRVANPVQGIIALLGSYVMMPVALSGAATDDRAVMIVANALMVVGTGGAALALASLGRCFGIFPEARGLVTHGLYRWVRHPMYLFEFIAFFGILLPALSLINALLFAAFVAFQLGRMHYEEQTLEDVFPAEYPAYRAKTARLIPGLY
jgi:protein-S-isoprenylcysteine O-methyltransferase Ste14